MEGIIGLDKPAGLTSFDVVAKLRKATGEKQIGHTGTLDPDATGVLVICLGGATRISSRLMEGTKKYSAQICFGTSTDSADASGRILESMPCMSLSRASFEDALSCFKGTISQRPPMFSAVKVGGKKLYELARQGLEAERPERQVIIHSLTASMPEGKATIDFGDRIPLAIECSHGTYIRTLCEDIGRKLGVPSHMCSLRRTWSSGWAVEDCLRLEEAISLAGNNELQNRLISISEALSYIHSVVLDEAEVALIVHGGSIVARCPVDDTEALLKDKEGRAVAIARVTRVDSSEGDKAIFQPKTVFIKPEEARHA